MRYLIERVDEAGTVFTVTDVKTGRVYYMGDFARAREATIRLNVEDMEKEDAAARQKPP